MSSNLVFLVGPSGSGKTVVAKRLARRLGWEVRDTDSLVAARAKRQIHEIFEEMGEAHFRKLEVQVIDELVGGCAQRPLIVATGGGLPEIDGMMQRLLSLGYVVYLSASLDVLWNRLTVDPQDLQIRPLLRHSGRAGLERLMKKRDPIYRMSTVTLRTDELDLAQVVAALVRQLSPPSPNSESFVR
ncbi:MAG: shikimate kinase [Candidatus Marsarchaeota archaeon]|nr:shikimate kinase [Candidatus Marsarchaeota archaeon]